VLFVNNVWFQQDDAISFCLQVRQFLNHSFHSKWIGRRDIEWSSRFFYMNPWIIFFGVVWKTLCVQWNLKTSTWKHKLRNHILNIATSIILENINNAKCSKQFLWMFVKFVDGQQFEHLINWKNINTMKRVWREFEIDKYRGNDELWGPDLHPHARTYTQKNKSDWETSTWYILNNTNVDNIVPLSFITQKYLTLYSSVWLKVTYQYTNISCWFNSIFCCNGIYILFYNVSLIINKILCSDYQF